MFPDSVKVIDIHGVELRIDPSWLVISALVVWNLATGYFPATVPGLHSADYVTLGALAMIALFASLVLHELAHASAARRLGLRTDRITLFIFGGVAEIQGGPQSPAAEFRIAVAGPAASFALAAVLALMSAAARTLGAPSGLVALGDYLARINLVLAAFNLVPGLPLDGGHILRAALWRASGDFLAATRQASLAGRAAGYALVGLGLVVLFTTRSPLAGLWTAFIGLFLAGAASAGWREMVTHRALRGRTVGELMTSAVHVVEPERTVSALVDEIMLRHGAGFVPVVENGIALGYVDTAAVRGIDRDNWGATRVEDVFIPIGPEMVATRGEQLDRLLARIAQTGRRKFIVTDGHAFAGVLTLSDLVDHVGVLRDLSPIQDSPAPRDV